MAKKVKMPGRIESTSLDGIVTGAAEIYDDGKEKMQNVINTEVSAELLRLENEKQDNLTFDNAPTEDSRNPVTSGGVFTAEKALSDAIEAILILIPSAATALNQLADKNFVNSSIATDTATFRGTSAIGLSEAQFLEWANGLTHDMNDYVFWQTIDEAGNTIFKRYKWNGTQWLYEYTLNNSSFTADQWAAIMSGITSALVEKLNGLPTNAALQQALNSKQNSLTFDNVPTEGSNNPVKSGGVYNAVKAEEDARLNLAQTVSEIGGDVSQIEDVIPAGATELNQLVANASMEAYVASIIQNITSSFTLATADGHINLTLTQTNGQVATLTLTSSDIASAQDVANLQQLYNNLQQSKPVPVIALPETGQQQGVIYRLAGTTSYSDYMWNGSTWVLMATYNNAVDPRPKKASQNLVTSGGVFDNMGALDVSELNATENPHTPAIYVNLSAALAAIPTDYQKGGMRIQFIQGTVQSSDNKYVQYRYMLQYENTTAGRDAFVNTKNWQGIDNEPLIDSDNLINSDSIARADFGITGTINFKRVFNGGIYHSNSSIEIPLKSGVMYPIILNNESEIDNVFVYYINNDNTKTSAKSITKGEQTTITPPEDKKGIALYKSSTGYKLVSISLTNPNSLKEYIESSDNVPTENSGKLIKSGAVYKELYGYNETYNFTHTTENGTFNFHIPAGNYTVSSNYTDLYSGLSLYFKDAEGNIITSDPIRTYINNGLQIDVDVEKIELYGSISTQGILSIIFASSEHTGGIKDDLNELQNDVSYLSSGLSLQKDILLNEEQVTVTGTGQYVNKTILTLEGNDIDNNCWYYFEADSFSGSQSAAPLTIIATINGVRTTVANSRVNPDALCFYNTNGNSVTKLQFVLYPLSSGAVFNGVRIYKMVDAVPYNVLDNVATSVVQKEALSRVVPSTTCKTIAHRGWNATAPKCMLSAVLEAKKNLCSIVENDVFNSKDEQLIMWHDTTLAYLIQIQDINGYILYLDPTLMGELTTEYGDELYYNITSPLYWLNPTTNNLYTWDGSQYVASSVDVETLIIPDVSHLSVKSFNLADLKRFDFGIWKNVKYKGETIPTFEEWVSYCKCIGVDIYIDKKINDTLMAEKIEEMVTIVRRHGMLRHATWLGFYPEVRTYDPKARCVLLTTPTSEMVNDQTLLQALEDGGEYSIIFEPEITQLTAENAALALDKGFGLEAYYVEFFPYDIPKSTIFQNMINAINLGCQGLTMDYYTVEDAIYGKYLK